MEPLVHSGTRETDQFARQLEIWQPALSQVVNGASADSHSPRKLGLRLVIRRCVLARAGGGHRRCYNHVFHRARGWQVCGGGLSGLHRFQPALYRFQLLAHSRWGSVAWLPGRGPALHPHDKVAMRARIRGSCSGRRIDRARLNPSRVPCARLRERADRKLQRESGLH